MSVKRCNEHLEFYDLIIEKYLELREDSTPQDRTLFASQIMVQLMDKSRAVPNRETRNSLILILSLFQGKDDVSKYKSYEELNGKERTILKESQQTILEM